VATKSLRRSVDETTAAAIADHEALYETLKEDYIEAGCLEKWGEFPSRTATTFTLTKESLKQRGGRLCNCAMLYDLASSAILPEKEDAFAAAALDGEDVSGEAGTGISRVNMWAMAQTTNSEAACSNGKADGYPCKNVDLLAHLPLNYFRTSNSKIPPKLANDVWGWTSANGREFIIWGVRDGTYFLEIRNMAPELLGFMPSSGGYALQHDMKVIKNAVYVGSEHSSHGLQVFNLHRLLDIDTNQCESNRYCVELKPDTVYKGSPQFPIGNSHNIVANPISKYIYIVGSESCKGGLHVVDVTYPLYPTFVGCFGGGKYVHDAQCVMYKGPDQNYKNKEICFCYNEDSVKIVDVSDKDNMYIISSTTYENVDYTHQGWLSSDHTHIVFGDEGEEVLGTTPRTRTLVMNVSNLKNPKNIQEYHGKSKAIDHNQYIVRANAKGQDYGMEHINTDLIYQANYEAGLRILQVIDYETADFEEVGFFDTYPLANQARFRGAWSSYPYFKSGVVVISSLEEGLFLVKPDVKKSLVAPKENPKNDCTDLTVRFQSQFRKNCKWVGRVLKGRPKFTIQRTRRRCRLKWRGKGLMYWCRETCGKVGLGKCRNKFAALDPEENVIPM